MRRSALADELDITSELSAENERLVGAATLAQWRADRFEAILRHHGIDPAVNPPGLYGKEVDRYLADLEAQVRPRPEPHLPGTCPECAT